MTYMIVSGLVMLGWFLVHCVRWRASEKKRRAALTPEQRSAEDQRNWFESQF